MPHAFRRYRSIKIVEAAKINEVDIHADGSATLVTPESTFAVSAAYVKKHEPQAGGYWVRYPDGYESWSPAKSFEEGYVPAEEY